MLDLAPLWISLKTAFASTTLAFIVGMLAAYAMFISHPHNSPSPYGAQKKPNSNWINQGWPKEGIQGWQGWIDSILTLPLILPPTVVGFLLLLLLGRNGPIGQVLERFGTTLLFSWPATVIAATTVAFPLIYKTVLAAFRQVDSTLLDCARTLGASERRIFFQLLLPLARPGVIAGTILAFARALGEFGATLMLAGSIPGKTETMPMAIFFAGEAGRLDEALVWTLILVSIALGAIATLNAVTASQWGGILDFRFRILEGLLPLLGGARDGFLRRVRVGNSHNAPNSLLPSQSPPTGRNRRGQVLNVNLTKELSDLTVSVQFVTDGRPLAILGASGSGKTTILRCVAGLMQPTSGRIVLGNRILFDSKQTIHVPAAQRRVGIVFQDYALFPHLTVAQNIAFGVQHLTLAEQRDRLSHYLNLFQLQTLASCYPAQLSGGQQQRVALARAIAPHPDLLLLDEPLSALDPHLRDRLQQYLANLFATYNGEILLVTHNVAEAYRLCDRWLILSEGQISADGPKQQLCDRPPTYAVAQMTQCKNLSRFERVEAAETSLGKSFHPRQLNFFPPDSTSLGLPEQKMSQNLIPIRALDWNGIILYVPAPLADTISYVGIHPYHVRILLESPVELGKTRSHHGESVGTNLFQCRILDIIEAQHHTLVSLSPNPLKSLYQANTEMDSSVQVSFQAQVSKAFGVTLHQYWANAPDAESYHCWVKLKMEDLILIKKDCAY
ncbi:MAG: molybdate ABC transporter permease subunit [Cyanobacteria bacterium P01_F01_bin.150]